MLAHTRLVTGARCVVERGIDADKKHAVVQHASVNRGCDPVDKLRVRGATAEVPRVPFRPDERVNLQPLAGPALHVARVRRAA